MPRIKAPPPTYRLHKASGQAVVTLNGRDFYLGPHGSAASRSEYDRLVAEWLLNDRRLPVEPTAVISVNEVILRYWGFVQSYYRKGGQPTSEVASIKAALRPLRRLYGALPASEFSPLKLKAVREEFIRCDNSRGVINAHMNRVKGMFKWAASEEIVPVSVYEGLRTVSGLRRGRSAARETQPVRPVRDSHIEAIRPYVSRQVWAMVQVQLLTGMRPSEVCLMRWCDIDTTEPVWRYRPAGHKTEHHGRDRVIAIGRRGQAVLKAFMGTQMGTHVFSAAAAEAERAEKRRLARKTPLWPSHQERYKRKRSRQKNRVVRDHYDRDSLRRAIARGCDLANAAERRRRGVPEGDASRLVPRWTPHQLRHNHATRVRQQFGLEAAQAALGHATADVTQLYAERDWTLAIRVAEELG